MTQKTKLEIIGKYRKDHPGPFVIDSPRSTEVLYEKVGVHCVVDGIAFVTTEYVDGPWCTQIENIMCAREVPVPREFWVNKYKFRELSGAYPTKGMADSFSGRDRVECIHVREVLTGEVE